jgi:hypothetical protein
MENKNTQKIEYPVIKYKGWDYVLNPFIKQKVKNGNDAEYLQSVKLLAKPAKYINKMERHHWIHIFYEYRETAIKKFYIEEDYHNNPISASYIN